MLHERFQIYEGIQMNKVTTDRFQTNLISIGFVRPLSKDTISELALLPRLLRRASRLYPTMLEIEKKLAHLYGASLEPYVRKYGETVVSGFIGKVIDEKHVPASACLLKEFVEMLCSVLTEPFASEQAFCDEFLESEKEKLCDYITSEFNDKRAYSIKRMIELMFEGEPFAVSKSGTTEQVNRITSKQLYQTYQELLQSAPIEICVCGNGNTEELISYFKEGLSGLQRKVVYDVQETSKHTVSATVKNITETLDIGQGKLTMGFYSGITLKDKQYPALMVANAVFGSGTTSKLFVHVREKMSLCYYASSYLDKFKGMMAVSSGIDPKDFEAAKKEILNQLSQTQQGNISEHELTDAKLTILSFLRSIKDSAMLTEDFLMNQTLFNCQYSLEELIENIEKVTKDMVADAASLLKPDTIYFLTGKEAENE